MNVLAVLRDPCFSPHSVAKDEAILKAVVRQLEERGCQVSVVSEQALTVPFPPDIVLSMGRHDETLRRLKAMGVRCINAPEAVGRCRRSTLQTIMQEAGIPIPPQEGTSGYWLKRGDSVAAMMPGDVVFAAETATLQQLQQGFRQRGITDMVVSAHVEGDELKFYGVRGTGFFRFFYADEEASHYAFSVEALRETAERLAAAVGLEVYGGDCIVRQDGTFCIIDFNDWPSFSRCREEAAAAIAERVLRVKE